MCIGENMNKKINNIFLIVIYILVIFFGGIFVKSLIDNYKIHHTVNNEVYEADE